MDDDRGEASAGQPRRKRGLAERLFYTPVHDRNVGSVKLLVDTVLPVRYSPDFFKKLMQTPYDFTKMVYFDDIFVGCIGCRVEGDGPSKKLYIMVLGVLAPYRGRGIGSELLRHVLEAAAKQPEIKEAYLHVWTSNEDAVRFYARHGFEVAETLPGYYRGITPPDCFVLRKVLQS